MRLIILAAGRGTRLAPLTDTRPKCMVEVAGRPLIDYQIQAARRASLSDIVIVGGYRAEKLPSDDASIVLNPRYENTNMVRSLFCARDHFGDGFVMSYGDIAYAPEVLEAVLAADTPFGVVVDKDWHSYWQERFANPLSDAETLRIDARGDIVEIGKKPQTLDEIEAQYIGLVVFRGEGLKRLMAIYDELERSGQMTAPTNGNHPLDGMFMTDLLQALIDSGYPPAAIPIHGNWIEVDSPSDLALSARLVAAGRLHGAR